MYAVVETHGSGAGAGGGGKLTVDVSLNGRSIPAKIEPEGDNHYHVSFVPIGSGVYTVRVYYAGVEVTGTVVESVSVGSHAHVDLHVPEIGTYNAYQLYQKTGTINRHETTACPIRYQQLIREKFIGTKTSIPNWMSDALETGTGFLVPVSAPISVSMSWALVLMSMACGLQADAAEIIVVMHVYCKNKIPSKFKQFLHFRQLDRALILLGLAFYY